VIDVSELDDLFGEYRETAARSNPVARAATFDRIEHELLTRESPVPADSGSLRVVSGSRSGSVWRLRCWLAGADVEVISVSPENDRRVYASIGAFVVFAALMAGVATAFAVDTMASGHSVLAVLAGLLGAVTMLLFDRSLLAGLHRPKSISFVAGTGVSQFLVSVLIGMIIVGAAMPEVYRSLADWEARSARLEPVASASRRTAEQMVRQREHLMRLERDRERLTQTVRRRYSELQRWRYSQLEPDRTVGRGPYERLRRTKLLRALRGRDVATSRLAVGMAHLGTLQKRQASLRQRGMALSDAPVTLAERRETAWRLIGRSAFSSGMAVLLGLLLVACASAPWTATLIVRRRPSVYRHLLEMATRPGVGRTVVARWSSAPSLARAMDREQIEQLKVEIDQLKVQIDRSETALAARLVHQPASTTGATTQREPV
jgi:hypothetical protein